MRSLPLFIFILGLLSLTFAIPPTLLSQNLTQVLHFTITRRGGKFAPTEFARDYVNLTYLAQELEKREDKFNLTKREIKGNKLVRKAKSNGVGAEDANALMGEVALDGIWSASSIHPSLRDMSGLLIHCHSAAGMRKLRLAIHPKRSRWT